MKTHYKRLIIVREIQCSCGHIFWQQCKDGAITTKSCSKCHKPIVVIPDKPSWIQTIPCYECRACHYRWIPTKTSKPNGTYVYNVPKTCPNDNCRTQSWQELANKKTI